MSDAKLNDLKRRRNTDPKAEGAYLRELLRSGQKRPEIELAAYCGYGPAQKALGWRCVHASVTPDGLFLHNQDDPSGTLITEPCGQVDMGGMKLPKCGPLSLREWMWGLLWVGLGFRPALDRLSNRLCGMLMLCYESRFGQVLNRVRFIKRASNFMRQSKFCIT